jgi:hypothetical protein
MKSEKADWLKGSICKNPQRTPGEQAVRKGVEKIV